jgi:hypothetical protein
MDLLAGQGVGLVGEIKPAGEIVRELVDAARQIVSRRLAGLAAWGLASGIRSRLQVGLQTLAR